MEELRVAQEAEDDGTYLLFYVTETGVVVKCGYVFADAREEVASRIHTTEEK